MGDRSHVLLGMLAGADDYLTNPLDPLVLRAPLLAAGPSDRPGRRAREPSR